MHVDIEVKSPPSQEGAAGATIHRRAWLRHPASYSSLVKSRQTLLLYATGICAYLISTSDLRDWLWLSLSLLLSISGCTMLNMVIDRDVDAIMRRTRSRPLPAGRLSPWFVASSGAALSAAGLGLALWLSWQVGIVIAAGFVFDLGVYSLWLKRRTPLSILFGGISGGMPALAGRTLAVGQVDGIGLLLALAILLWIPSHFVTLTTKYRADYQAAGIPTWAGAYGESHARRFIALANLLNAGVLVACGILLDMRMPAFIVLLASALAMVVLAILGMARPDERLTWLMFKAASIHMLLSFVAITLGVRF